LEAKVQMGAHPFIVCYRSHEIVAYLGRFEAAEPNAKVTRQLRESVQ
jgi:hypothetical protein